MSRTYRLNQEMILETCDRRGWMLQELARYAGVDAKTITNVVVKGRNASLTVLKKLAAALGEKDHMALVYDATPAASNDVPSIPLVEISIKVMGHPETIKLHSVTDITSTFKAALSEAAKIFINDIRNGSVYIDLVVNERACDDILEAFMDARLQHLGVYEIKFTGDWVPTPREVCDAYLNLHSFFDDSVTARFTERMEYTGAVTVASIDATITVTTKYTMVIAIDRMLQSTLSPEQIKDAEEAWSTELSPPKRTQPLEEFEPPRPAFLVDYGQKQGVPSFHTQE